MLFTFSILLSCPNTTDFFVFLLDKQILLLYSLCLKRLEMKMSPNISSGEIIGSNEDLITEILIHLPVKSLMRFKSVSKHWLSLVSNPRFCHRHTRLNGIRISGILLRRKPTEFEFLSLNGNSATPPFNRLDFVDDPSGIKILQSCNGLLICSSHRKVANKRNYYVFNPSTKQFSMLPPIVGVFGVALAFEPTKSPYYKVVCVRSSVASIYCYEIEMYSSETRSWKICGSPFAAPFDMVFDDGLFHNGLIHWISPTGASLIFDVNDECFISMPNVPFLESWGKRRFRYFAESCGHLHFFEVYGSRSTQFKIFEMEKDDDDDSYQWFFKYHVDLHPLVTAFPEMVKSYLDSCDSTYYAFIVLSLVCEENEDDLSLLLHIPGKFISYSVKDKTFKKIYELAPSHARTSLQFGCRDAYQYIETLACV